MSISSFAMVMAFSVDSFIVELGESGPLAAICTDIFPPG